MAEELIHGFTGGLNKDLATSLVQADSYIDANNIRIVTQEGQSSGILMNILGNELSFTIPNVSGGFKTYSTSGVSTGSYSLNIGGTIVSFTVNYAQPIRPQIQSVLGPYITAGNIFVYINGSELIILEGFSTINLTLVSGASIVINTVSPITNLQMIGWTTIRDTIVLFTCPEVANGTGQIWTVDYNSVTQTTSGCLLRYTQALNFDSKHPIQAIGRYETTDIQRVYWTDNYNPPRSFNLTATNAEDTDIDLINLTSSTTLNIPILSEISTGGSLLAGSYQYTYRLKKKNGTYSVIAPLSNLVNIVSSVENTTDFQNYQGSDKGTVTGKSVKYNINNTDNTYDFIEHIFLFKDTYNTVPLIYIYKEENAVVGNIPVTHSANTGTNYVPITLEELLISSQNEFQKVKTIATKDNMLFFGNTKSQSFKVDYDARAYRHSNSGVAKIIDRSRTAYPYGDRFLSAYADYATVPKDHDAVNEYNSLDDGVFPPSPTILYKYQANGTTLGGQGTNVKYEFTYVDGIVDNATNTLKTASPFFTSDRTTASYYLDIPGQTYPQNNFYNNIKSPYYSSIYTGYARGEIYRFGIVFYDKSGRQSYANWIGDIRIPYHDEPGFYMGNIGGAPYLKTTARQIGIKFIITIPAGIKSTCSGYSIVRVERDDNNKSKLATGVLGELTANLHRGNYCNSTRHTIGGSYGQIKTLDGPAFHFNNVSYRQGDYLRVIGVTDTSDGLFFKDYGNDQSYSKSYTTGTTNNPYPDYNDKFPINKYNFVYPSATVSADIPNGLPLDYINMGDPMGDDFQAAGGRTSLITLDTAINVIGLDFEQMIFVSYQRDLVDQYGGDTYSARSNNTYINCSNFFPMDSSSTLGFDVFNVFGGDTFVNYYDHTKYDKNYPGETPYGWNEDEGDDDYVFRSRFARVYLAESPINTDLRQGSHFNKNQADNGTGLYGDFIYNPVYSQQNNTRVYIPEPFIDTTQEEFDSRIWYSKTKINGEQTDNWTFIDGYKDIESVYGPINRLEVLNDNLFAFQDRAVANILVNPLSVIQDNNASNLVLGKATGVIQKHIYLSTEIGCKHQWSVVKSDQGIYWFDILGKRLCKLEGPQTLELSDAKGLFSYFQENLKGDINNIVHNSAYLVGDSPTYQYGITAGYDYRNKEVVFTFLDTNKQFTLAYSEVLGKFTSFYSFKPNLYIYTKDKFISADPETLKQVYLHNIDNTYGSFYGTSYDSDFSVITNKFPANTKVYDNLELFSEVTINNVDTGSSFNKVQCTTKYQDSGLITLTPSISIKRRERSWRLFVPRDTGTTGSSFQARLRDKYLITKLVFTNADNKKLLLHWLKVLFRASIS